MGAAAGVGRLLGRCLRRGDSGRGRVGRGSSGARRVCHDQGRWRRESEFLESAWGRSHRSRGREVVGRGHVARGLLPPAGQTLALIAPVARSHVTSAAPSSPVGTGCSYSRGTQHPWLTPSHPLSKTGTSRDLDKVIALDHGLPSFCVPSEPQNASGTIKFPLKTHGGEANGELCTCELHSEKIPQRGNRGGHPYLAACWFHVAPQP